MDGGGVCVCVCVFRLSLALRQGAKLSDFVFLVAVKEL